MCIRDSICEKDGEIIVNGSTIDLLESDQAENLFFKAEALGRQVSLYWASNTTFKDDYYVIEHSTNGIDFQAIQETMNLQSSTDFLNYQVYDEHPDYGKNYYRIKQYFVDGT